MPPPDLSRLRALVDLDPRDTDALEALIRAYRQRGELEAAAMLGDAQSICDLSNTHPHWRECAFYHFDYYHRVVSGLPTLLRPGIAEGDILLRAEYPAWIMRAPARATLASNPSFGELPALAEGRATRPALRERDTLGYHPFTTVDALDAREAHGHVYRKRPLEIEAIRYTRDSADAVEAFCAKGWDGATSPCYDHNPDGSFALATIEGEVRVRYGDWVIRGVEGELYPCSDSIFRATYDPAE
jgi:hypothetical protein